MLFKTRITFSSIILASLFGYASTVNGQNELLNTAFIQETELHESVDIKKPSISKDTIHTDLFWDFNDWNSSEGWFIPEPVNGGISGGAIWFLVDPNDNKQQSSSWDYQVWGDNPDYAIASPKGLGFSAREHDIVQMRLLNRSPETDGVISWKTKNNTESSAGEVRFTMKPDYNEWQLVTCYMDSLWVGTIDQIKIRPAQMWMRGDIWIDWIKITKGNPKPMPPRPDLHSKNIVPVVNLPGIKQNDFQQAFDILDECLVTDIPMKGFNYPFLAPGGAYGQSWWQLDGSLNIAGAKWVNQKFVEDMMRGFAGVQSQNPDGRIDLWGGSPMRGTPANVSSLPRFFDAAFDVATRTKDRQLQELIHDTMKKYLQYWFSSVKRDSESGLITAVFEESFSDKSFGDKNAKPGVLAPVDLNVAVAIGCYNTSKLAEYLGRNQDVHTYLGMFEELSEAINNHLWNKDKNAYYNYDVQDKKMIPRLICTTFDPMRLGIAPDEYIEKMIPVLVNPDVFNWGIRPLTSIAKTEDDFREATGSYDGTAWFGDVWTMRNMQIVSGLEDAGRHALAAELAWATVKMFNNNFAEYIVPSTGSGEGVERYGWTASQYTQAIIEHLFGIKYNQFDERLYIFPHIPQEFIGHTISISNLLIPGGNDARMSLTINCKKEKKIEIDIELTGDLPTANICVLFPKTEEKKLRKLNGEKSGWTTIDKIENRKNYRAVNIPIQESLKLIFE